jgi:hypothetical protein
MPTRAAENGRPGVGVAAKEVAEHASALARLALELAGHELKRKAGALGAGAGLGLGAAVTAVFGLGFVFAAIAAALTLVLATWLALLVVAGGLLALAGLLGALALGRFRRGTPPVPQEAIREARRTTEALRG